MRVNQYLNSKLENIINRHRLNIARVGTILGFIMVKLCYLNYKMMSFKLTHKRKNNKIV